MLFTFIRLTNRVIMASEKPLAAFVLGAPGAGKGTQCAKIVEEFGYVHLSAGDLLRAEKNKEGSEYGELIQSHIKNGSIVPVAITISLLERAMDESSVKKFLIDGFPRNEDNLAGWTERMTDKVDLKFVLFFECSEEECVNRCLKRGEEAAKGGAKRTDDNEESLKKRFHTHMTSTMPIIEHYDKLNLVQRVQANRTPDEVFADVKKLFTDEPEKPVSAPEPAVDQTPSEPTPTPEETPPTEEPKSSSWFCSIL